MIVVLEIWENKVEKRHAGYQDFLPFLQRHPGWFSGNVVELLSRGLGVQAALDLRGSVLWQDASQLQSSMGETWERHEY